MKKVIKKTSKKILVALLIVIVTFSFAGCTSLKASSETSEYGNYAYSILEEINDGFSQRVAGAKSEKIMAEFIFKELASFGLNSKEQTFSYEKTDKTTKEVSTVHSQNIIAKKLSNKSDAKDIIIGAHYDSSSAGKGIDDNGSGVAVLLELAKYYSSQNSTFNLVFVFFGAEEVGLKGSKSYVENMTAAEKSNTQIMINLDTLAGGDNMYVYGGTDAVSIDYLSKTLDVSKEKKLEIDTQKGLNADYVYGTTGDWSDHSPFKYAEIPFLYFEATNWDVKDSDGNYTDGYVQVMGELLDYAIMHTAQDNLSYINSQFEGRVQKHMSNFVQAIIEITK